MVNNGPRDRTLATPVSTRRRVTFAKNHVVHEVPRGGREQEPGYLRRVVRYAALKHHLTSLKQPRVSRRSLDDMYGNGTPGSWGQRGQYTDTQARRNTWHMRRHGTPWYRGQRVKVPGHQHEGKLTFVPRYTKDAHASTVDTMLLEYQMGRHSIDPFNER